MAGLTASGSGIVGLAPLSALATAVDRAGLLVVALGVLVVAAPGVGFLKGGRGE